MLVMPANAKLQKNMDMRNGQHKTIKVEVGISEKV